MSQLFTTGDLDEAKERARDLRHWLEGQGFPPHITGHVTFDRLAAKAACTALFEC